MKVFNLVQREFQRSGISQADLAERMGKGADRVCRLLGSPGNWTLDTVSDLLFAMSGAEINYDVAHPLDKPVRNQTKPEWCDSNISPSPGAAMDETAKAVLEQLNRERVPRGDPIIQNQSLMAA